MEKVDLKKLGNVSLIVIGVALASFGEIDFVLIGFLYQIGGIIFEATRICLVQRLLNGDEFKMDPLVSLYYFAPVCAVMNVVVAVIWEVPKCTMAEVYAVGLWTLFLNASVAFALNCSVVFLVRIESPSTIQLLTSYRSEELLASSSPSAVSLRTSCLSGSPSSSGERQFPVYKLSATASPSSACSTTSWDKKN